MLKRHQVEPSSTRADDVREHRPQRPRCRCGSRTRSDRGSPSPACSGRVASCRPMVPEIRPPATRTGPQHFDEESQQIVPRVPDPFPHTIRPRRSPPRWPQDAPSTEASSPAPAGNHLPYPRHGVLTVDKFHLSVQDLIDTPVDLESPSRVNLLPFVVLDLLEREGRDLSLITIKRSARLNILSQSQSHVHKSSRGLRQGRCLRDVYTSSLVNADDRHDDVAHKEARLPRMGHPAAETPTNHTADQPKRQVRDS